MAAQVTLTISPAGNGEYLVVVNGEGFHHAENAEVGVRIRGDDEWFDDRLFSMRVGFPARVLGGTFTVSETVSGSRLNEDWGQDEVYALVTVKGSDYKSNTVKGHF